MKTAVQWLQDTWLNYPDLCSYDKIQEWFKQAKEMEKEQIMNACKVGFFEGREYIGNQNHKFSTPEDYYNETFKSE